MDRVGGDQRALQIEHLQQRARRDDFAAARRHRFLADHQLRLCGEGGDHLKRARSGGAVEGAAQRLAVDRHHPAAVCAQRVEKAPEAGRQRPRIDQPQQPRKRVVARQAILKMQKLPEKLLPILGEVREFDATLAAADRRRQRDRQNLKQIMPRRIAGARVGNFAQNRDQTTHRFLPLRNRPKNPFQTTALLNSPKCDSPGAGQGCALGLTGLS